MYHRRSIALTLPGLLLFTSWPGASANGALPPAPTSANATPDATAPFRHGSPIFQDLFKSDDPFRWITFDGAHWPPLASQTGTWSRLYYQGWPTNTGSQDSAARSLAGNHEAQCYEDRAVSITGDGLVLTATRDDKNHFGLPWTSGTVSQARRLGQRYGYFEADITMPDDRAAWGAWWFRAADDPVRWPPEFDVVDKPNVNARGASSALAFRSGIAGGQGNSDWCTLTRTGRHVYGLHWTAETMEVFIDGVSVFKVPTPSSMHCPMYMLFNLAIGGRGSWPGEPAASLTSSRMTVHSTTTWALR